MMLYYLYNTTSISLCYTVIVVFLNKEYLLNYLHIKTCHFMNIYYLIQLDNIL